MHSRLFACLIFVAASLAPSMVLAQVKKSLTPAKIKKTIRQLKPLHEEIGETQPGDWLNSHEEKGQTFQQYVRIRPNILTRQRNKLYIQPIGEFSEEQIRLIKLSHEFLGIYFNCEVETLETKSEKDIPADAQRDHPRLRISGLAKVGILCSATLRSGSESAFGHFIGMVTLQKATRISKTVCSGHSKSLRTKRGTCSRFGTASPINAICKAAIVCPSRTANRLIFVPSVTQKSSTRLERIQLRGMKS